MTQQPPGPTLEERVSDAVFKLIVAGSGGYALYNLYLEEIPKAAIAALISAGAGFTNRSWQTLLQPIGEWWNTRLGRTGQTLKQQVESFDQKLSGVSHLYMEALKGYCQDLEVEGYKGYLLALPLKDVYVPLKINADFGQALKFEDPKTVWDFLPKTNNTDTSVTSQRLAIIANPGFGKTTLTRYLTLSFADQSYKQYGVKALFPVLLLLRSVYPQIRYDKDIDTFKPSLPELMVQKIKRLPRCQNLPPFDQWLQTQLQNGDLLVIFDGLDEVPDSQRETVSRWINWQMQAYDSQFILTSRPHGYDATLFRGVRQVGILPFTNPDKIAFITQWYETTLWIHKWRPLYDASQRKAELERLSIAQAEAQSKAEATERVEDLTHQLFKSPDLTTLAENPLLVTIIATTHQAFESLPRYRKDLYKRIFDLLLEHRPNRRETRLTIPTAEDNQAILQKLALNLVNQGWTQFAPKQGAEWIRQSLARLRPDSTLTPEGYLCEIQEVSGLLAGGEGELYQFTHKTFQEYLAAVELKQQRQGKKVTEQLDNPDWEETVCFYAALTDPVPFIQFALKNPTEYTLKLAQRLKEESTQVNDDLYSKLLKALRKLAPESPEITLQQRFTELVSLTDTAGIIADYITWGEYQLFLRDQAEKQFHSWAEERRITADQRNEKVTDLRWEDAQWFCAWLSTQPNLGPEGGVYDYRLPTVEELDMLPLQNHKLNQQTHESSLQTYTADPKRLGNAIQVVRHRLPDRYGNLISYLANGQWKDADQETDQLMLKVVGKQAEDPGFLTTREVRNFPSEDLWIIDHLWVKFSGSKFGFSIQKQIWLEVGGKLDFTDDEEAGHHAYFAMSKRNGWRIEKFLTYSQLNFSISAPIGHLPARWSVDPFGEPSMKWDHGSGALLSHPIL